jgi:hypothetical protein
VQFVMAVLAQKNALVDLGPQFSPAQSVAARDGERLLARIDVVEAQSLQRCVE